MMDKTLPYMSFQLNTDIHLSKIISMHLVDSYLQLDSNHDATTHMKNLLEPISLPQNLLTILPVPST